MRGNTGVTWNLRLDYIHFQFWYCENTDCSVHYTLKKKIINCLPSFFKYSLVLIFYCFLIQFCTIINMFYDIFVMGMRSLTYVNIKGFFVVFS